MSAEEMIALTRKYTMFSWVAQNVADPIAVEVAKGAWFHSADGKDYLDFNSQAMSVNIGHGDQRVADAVSAQMRKLAYAYPHSAHEPRARLGAKLASLTPGDLDVMFFTTGGADANENAIKLARAYTGKHKILTRYRSYHGATAGAMAATGDPRRIAWEPGLMPGVVHFLDPYRYRSTFHRTNPGISETDFCTDYLNHLEEIIHYEGPETIAAVMIETVTGTNGVIIPP
jgi:taurine--2-oxoglutarate transaminase